MREIRRDPTTGGWTIVCPERVTRPLHLVLPRQDPVPPERCPFCQGNEHATERPLLEVPQGAWKVRVFPNKFPALRVEGALERRPEGIYDRTSGIGANEVIVESPHHDAALHEQPEQMRLVLRVARERLTDLRRDSRMAALSWYRNHGVLAGASQPHPHSQVLASAEVPGQLVEMARRAREHQAARGRALLDDIVAQELADGGRIVRVGSEIAAFCPYAPRVPFEVWLAPLRGGARFVDATDEQLDDLGDALCDVVSAHATALDDPSYNVFLYTAPVGMEEGFRWHLRVFPRLRVPAAWELGTGSGVVVTPPEQAARVLIDALPTR